MGPRQSPFLWRLRNRMIYKAPLTHSLLNFTFGVFMIFERKTSSLIEKTYLHQIFCKVKDWIKNSKQSMQPWSRVQVCEMENVEINDVNSKYDFSLFLNLLNMASFSLFLICEPSCAHIFFGSCFFGTPSFLSTSMWVMLLWHAIFPLYLTLGHASLACHFSSLFFSIAIS